MIKFPYKESTQDTVIYGPLYWLQLKGYIGLIQVKEGGWTVFSKGWQGCSKGFPEGEAQVKSRGVALPARGKHRPSQLFYSDLHSI